MIKGYLNGRRCALLGLGVSNVPLARYICNEARLPLKVYDKADVSALGDVACELASCGVEFYKVEGDFSCIDADVIFRSPGIRPDRIRALGDAEITSEMELFLTLTPAVTFAITGSDGKTTTTTLVGKMLEEEYKGRDRRVFVGGNIGKPLLCECEGMTERDAAVLELSSFQLMSMSHSPSYCAITNVSPNHLDWHTGMDEYISAKMNIVGDNTRRLVTNADCVTTLNIARELCKRDGLELVLFSSTKTSFAEIFDGIPCVEKSIAIYERDGYITVDDGSCAVRALNISDIRIPGRHNVENYMTAIGLTFGCVDTRVYSPVARSFFGVEHRLELVGELDSVRYYNSSIDSSPTRTAAALSALKDERIVLICGGYDKKIPYAPLAKSICTHGGVRVVSLTGATGERIGEEIEKYRDATGQGADITLLYNKDFTDAVAFAHASARSGDCVLLSPASASFDAFKNFAERGRVFKEIIMGY